MAIPTETKEIAYQTWRECGQNLSECERILNKDLGYVISRQSLHAWKSEYDWEGRAARAEAEARHMEDASSSASIMAALLKQRTKYETYLENLPVGSVDNQAIYAFNQILKTIVDIRQATDSKEVRDVDRPKVFLEDMQFIAGALKELDPEGLKVFARNFDSLVSRFKEAHAQAA